MPVDIDTTGDFFEGPNANGLLRLVFRNPRGNKNYYALYAKYSGSPAGFVSEYSSDGTTWSNTPQQLNSSGSLRRGDAKIYDDGSQLVIFVAYRVDIFSGNSDLYYRRGIIGDSDDDITWDSEQTVKATLGNGLGTSDTFCAIARTDNGRLVVAFTEDTHSKCKDYRQTKLIGSDGDGASPTWSGETTWDDPSSSANNENKSAVYIGLESYSSSVLSGNGVLIFGRIPDATSAAPNYKITTDEVTWNGTAFGDISQTDIVTNHNNHGKWMAGLIDESDFGHIIYFDGSNTRFDSVKSGTAGSDNWGTAATIKSNTIDACALALDTVAASHQLYAFYHDTADSQDFHYKTKDASDASSGAWDSEQTITYAQDVVAITTWNRDVENSLHIAGERVSDFAWYHELVLAVPFIPELPFMVNQAINRSSTY